MNRAKTPRIVALILAAVFTGLTVQSIADYAHPQPAPVALAKSTTATAR